MGFFYKPSIWGYPHDYGNLHVGLGIECGNVHQLMLKMLEWNPVIAVAFEASK